MADLILAPYFTKDISYHQHDSSNKGRGGSKPDDYTQMKIWYESIVKYDLPACIFHNELTDDFINKYTTKKISFHRWEKQHRPSYNDERFYAYLEYLTTHTEVERAICTDLYDVEFYGNVFDWMDKNEQYDLFFGEERMGRFSSKWMVEKCRRIKLPLISNKYAPGCYIYNAGIVGGKRKPLMKLLTRMIAKFEKINPKENANMPVFNYCADQTKGYKIFSGFPLHNVFNSNVVIPGTYIKHK